MSFVLLWKLEAAVSMATNPLPYWGTTTLLRDSSINLQPLMQFMLFILSLSLIIVHTQRRSQETLHRIYTNITSGSHHYLCFAYTVLFQLFKKAIGEVRNDSLETNANFWLRAQCLIMREGVLAPSLLRLNHLALFLVRLTTQWQTSPVSAEPSGEIDAKLRQCHLSFWHRNRLFRNHLDSHLCGRPRPSIALCLHTHSAEPTDCAGSEDTRKNHAKLKQCKVVQIEEMQAIE